MRKILEAVGLVQPKCVKPKPLSPYYAAVSEAISRSIKTDKEKRREQLDSLAVEFAQRRECVASIIAGNIWSNPRIMEDYLAPMNYSPEGQYVTRESIAHIALDQAEVLLRQNQKRLDVTRKELEVAINEEFKEKPRFDGFKIKTVKEDDGDWLAHFIELPHISAAGDTPGQALRELEAAWELLKEDYRAEGKEIPTPTDKIT